MHAANQPECCGGMFAPYVCSLQWEDATDAEEDWETAEAPVSVSGAAGSFDVDASAEAGVNLPFCLL